MKKVLLWMALPVLLGAFAGLASPPDGVQEEVKQQLNANKRMAVKQEIGRAESQVDLAKSELAKAVAAHQQAKAEYDAATLAENQAKSSFGSFQASAEQTTVARGDHWNKYPQSYNHPQRFQQWYQGQTGHDSQVTALPPEQHRIGSEVSTNSNRAAVAALHLQAAQRAVEHSQVRLAQAEQRLTALQQQLAAIPS